MKREYFLLTRRWKALQKMEEQFIVKAGYKINKKKFDYFGGRAGVDKFGNIINQLCLRSKPQTR